MSKTTYYRHEVGLSDDQKAKLLKAYKTKTAITPRLKNHDLVGDVPILLTKTQVNKIRRSKRDGTGTEIKISVTQMTKQQMQEGGLLSALIPMATNVAKQALPHVMKVATPLATDALSGLSKGV